jgi:hypothetical protein
MIMLEKIVQTEFENIAIDDVVKLLAEHNLYAFIIDSITQINSHLKNQKEEIKNFGCIKVSHIASSLLIKINEHFRNLPKGKQEKQKGKLEYLLGNITKRIIKSTIDALPGYIRGKQLSVIQIALSETCLLYKYDFEKLTEFVQIDDLVREVYVEYTKSIRQGNHIDLSIENKLPGFRCTSPHVQNSLESLLGLFQELQISNEIEKLRTLFNGPTENLAISFNNINATYVMQFLVVLNFSNMIESDNKRYGFYQVLECHVLNFKEVFLKGKDGQRGADRVRRLKDWEERKCEFNKHLNNFLKNTSS